MVVTMAQSSTNSAASSNQFNQSYAVDFKSKRLLRPESLKFVLGRSETSDFVIPSLKVSDKHCEISCSGDSWLLHNLSADGTSVVGRGVARNGAMNLGEEAIVKLGNVYVQCKPEMEATVPPTRVLKLSVLMGEKCHLAGQCEDEHEEVPDDNEPDASAPENEQGQSIEMASANGTDSSASTPGSDEISGEINGIINNMASENERVEIELRETKKALRKAIKDKTEKESALASLEAQLVVLYQQEENNRSMLTDLTENELQCSICNEIIYQAVTLNCSHSYCSHCLVTWRRNKNICPICRQNIGHECKTRMIDDTVEKIVRSLPEDAKQRRAELIEARRGGY